MDEEILKQTVHQMKEINIKMDKLVLLMSKMSDKLG